MKLLLVYPGTWAKGLGQVIFLEPITLEFLAAGVSDKHEVKIIDLRIKNNLEEAIRSWEPNVVGITGFTLHVPEMINISKRVKTVSKDITVAVGGHHATFMPKSFMVSTVDIIARRECESIIEQILVNNLTKIPGLIYRKKGEWVENRGEPPPIFPRLTPARHLIKQYEKHYQVFNLSCMATQISRGCPYSCYFCDSQKFFHGRYQLRPASSIADEIATSWQQFIFPVDENIGINQRFLSELLRELKERKVKKKYLITINVTEVLNNKNLFDRLIDIGALVFFLGLERVDDESIALLGKKTNVAMNDEAIKYIHSRGGIIAGSFIILPTDTVEYFKRLEDYVKSRQIDIPLFSILTPFPGTDILEWYDELSSDFSEYDLLHAVMPTTLPKEEFYRHYKHLFTTFDAKRILWNMLKVFGIGKWLLKSLDLFFEARRLRGGD